MAEELRSIPIEEAEHQTEESDVAFMSRLVERHDGTCAVKQGRLVCVMRGSMQSASGASLPPVVVAPGRNLLRYRVTWSDKPVHGKVEARWFDRFKVEPRTVEVPVGDGGEEVVAKLPEPFPTEAEAKRAAEAKARELTRGDGTATFEVEGDPAMGAEIPVQAQGIRAGVNGLWVPTRVEHRVDQRGYSTRAETETPGNGDSRGDTA
jgi:phage protein D